MKRFAWSVILAVLVSYGCSGGGCDGMVPTPGGFPANERVANAGQIRVSNTGIQAITEDPEALLGGLLGGMGLQFDVPANCGGSTPVCCPGGTPQSPCGPIVIDLAEQPGDAPRLVVTPVQGQSRLDLIVRARVRTQMDLPVTIPLVGDCGVHIDTDGGQFDDVRIDLPVTLAQDAMAGTTRVQVGDATLTQLSDEDVDLTGGFGCQLANFGVGLFIDTLSSQFTDQISGAIEEQVCKACPSGDVGECGPFAASCDSEVCMKSDGTCLQELGITGRMIAYKMFGQFSPTLGGMDIYEVAGGYATTNNNGVALGLRGGMLPAGAPRDRCGPPATAPAQPTIPQSPHFQGNVRVDNGQPFDMAIGLHESQLDELAFAMYDGGFICLSPGTRSIDLLTTDTLALIMPSLSELVSETSPVVVGLRPQSPPTIDLGRNTFIDMGGEPVPDEPLLDINFTQMEIDFFASVEGHYVRLFTLVSDVHLPVGLQVAAGELVPVLGSVDDAFTNLSVKNSEALAETPEELATRFPAILQIALPQLGAGLGGFALPELGGLVLNVTDITAVDGVQFMAIFADLAIAMPRVETTAEVIEIREPGAAVQDDPASWERALRPSATLVLGGGDGLEWQLRVDGGLWSPWSATPVRTISQESFWVQGTHEVEVRARTAGQGLTTDPTPVVLQVPIGRVPALPTRADKTGPHGFHGAPGEGGCNCSTGTPAGGLPIVLALVAILIPRRRRSRPRRAPRRGLPRGSRRPPSEARRAPSGAPSEARLRGPRAGRRGMWWTAAVVAALAPVPGCDCGSGASAPCGDIDCLPGEVAHGAGGRWNGAASDGTRTVVSTYESQLGDLVVVDVVDVAAGTFLYDVVDGIPEETPVYEPTSYRGGIAGPGPDVGAWSSIALAGGLARAAYQDRETGALRVAIELDQERWRTYQVDDRGMHTSIAIGGNGFPVVTYLATGVPGASGVTSELRLARASGAEPSDSDWQVQVLAAAPASCAGACPGGQVCLASPGPGMPETCATPATSCAPACGDTEACVGGSCVEAVADPVFVDLPTGTGLFPTTLVLPSGLAVVYYDRVRTALVLLVESGGSFTETVLDGAGEEDRGMWATAVADGGTIHVAYQDGIGDQVFYTSWNGSPGAIELVDDGVRAGDRTHPVGAGASIYVSGGEPAIAYQDGLVSDLVVARRSGGTWTATPFTTGAALDGFHVATAPGIVVWDRLDRGVVGVHGLQVQTAP
jgi:MYXO-CTERM domain-containing protein